MMTQKGEKSRDISLSDFFTILQVEWLSYWTRAKIYKKDFADNYAKICEGKRFKIESIAQRNNLPCIFTNSDYLKKYIDKFMPEYGLPNFQYKDQEIRDKMERWDKYYFFNKGCSVKFKYGGSIYTGVVAINKRKECMLVVNSPEFVELELHYNNVSKILPDNFFEF